MEPDNAIIFWNHHGEALLTVVGHEIPSDKLLDIFDTPEIHQEIEKLAGFVDNTSEELVSLQLKD
jgi:hypothetical protein